MKLSIEILEAKDACLEGKIWYKAQNPTSVDSVEKCVEKLLSETNESCPEHLRWANWLLTNIFTKDQNVKYAIFSAKKVLHIFENKYPKDKRPRKAIEAAEVYLINPCEETKAAAEYAWDAARAVAEYAWAARAAAAGAAARAAWAAGDAAWAAAWAVAWDAAGDAARGAAYDSTLIEIIRFGLTLIV